MLANNFDSLRQELDSPIYLALPEVSLEQRLPAQQSTIRRINQVAEDLDNILL